MEMLFGVKKFINLEAHDDQDENDSTDHDLTLLCEGCSVCGF